MGEYVVNVLKEADRRVAALLGWNGKYTISAECWRDNCIFCKLVKASIERLWPGHCERAAKNEGVPQ